jgi:hypothetical protein
VAYSALVTKSGDAVKSRVTRVFAAVTRQFRRAEPKPLTALYAVEARLAEAQEEASRCAAAVQAALVGADEAYGPIVEAFGAERPMAVQVVELQTQLHQVKQRMGEVEAVLVDAVAATNLLRYGSTSGPSGTTGPASAAAPGPSRWRRLVSQWSWADTRLATYGVAPALMVIFWWRGWFEDSFGLVFSPFWLVILASFTFDRSTRYERSGEFGLWVVAAIWAAGPLLAWTLGSGSVAGLSVGAAINVAIVSALAIIHRRRRLAEEATAPD